MTIDDFIATYKSYSKDYKKEAYNMDYSTQQRDYARDKAREYEQLAEWLEELKTTRIALEKANGHLAANWKLGYQNGRADEIRNIRKELIESELVTFSQVVDFLSDRLEQLKAGGTE